MERLSRLAILLLVAFAALVTPYGARAANAPSGGDYFVYVGTYTRKTSKGLYAFRFNTSTGHLTSLGLVAEVPSPSFVAANPNGRFLYASNEREYNEVMGKTVSAFAIDPETGHLTLLKRTPSAGDGPAHILVDPTGKVLVVNNYRGGNVAVLPIEPDGTLGEATSVDQHHGPGGDPKRVPGPHPHSGALSPDNRFLLTTDSGLDQVMAYRFDAAKGAIAPASQPFYQEDAASAPWHVTFHPSGKFAYATNETISKLTVFTFSEPEGKLQLIQTVPSTPGGVTQKGPGIGPAEVRVDKAGRFLYVSNRGHDSIAVFAIDHTKGTLSLIQDVPSGGKIPRSITFDPTGNYLLAGNGASNNLTAFQVDSKTGHLTSTGQLLDVPEPASIVFVPARAAH